MNTFLTVASLYCILIHLMWSVLTVCNTLICLHYLQTCILALHPVDSCPHFFILQKRPSDFIIQLFIAMVSGTFSFSSFIQFLGRVIISFKHRLSNAFKSFTPLSTGKISGSNSNISSRVCFIKAKKDCRCLSFLFERSNHSLNFDFLK